MENTYLRLFFVAFLFMLLFQLEARLLNYVYLFHEGLLLIQAMLLGGGLLLLAQEVIPKKYNRILDSYTPVLLVFLFLIQQFVFYYFNAFLFDFITLSLLFAFIFREITNLIAIKSNIFYSIELLGSLAGIALYIFFVQHYLEEVLFSLTLLLFFVYAFVYTPHVKLRAAFLAAMLLLVSVYVGVMKQSSVPVLLQCSEDGTSYGYKAACLDDVADIKPVESFSHVKGRTDVYIREDAHNLNFLEVKNNGYRVSSGNQEVYRTKEWFDLLEVRIPKFAYKPESHVLSVGAGAGSYVQALQSYIVSPKITAVEIDKTVEDINTFDKFAAFLPDQSSYDIVYEEGRRYMTLNDTTYDVITVAIEAVNSTLPKYTDERSGLLYTKEALETYIRRLNSDGYLVLEQYYPQNGGGPEMAIKFLRTLQRASGVSKDEFRDKLYMYSWAFHKHPNAQRFISAVYKPDGFTDADIDTIRNWIERLDTTDLGGGPNPHDVQILHEPGIADDAVVFAPYFNQGRRAAIDANANTSPITDEKPFRHLVTTLPLPPFSYAIFAFMAVMVLLTFNAVWQRFAGIRIRHTLVSFGLGLVTFGLQYLLFYKTASFLSVNLIFFSVFLLLPIFFGAIGGYISTLMPRSYDFWLITVLAISAFFLSVLNVFMQPQWLIFFLVAVIFVVAGILFPRVLETAQSSVEKRVIYAVNLIAGGFALMLMVTLHATIGWSYAFIVVVLCAVTSILLLRKL